MLQGFPDIIIHEFDSIKIISELSKCKKGHSRPVKLRKLASQMADLFYKKTGGLQKISKMTSW